MAKRLIVGWGKLMSSNAASGVLQLAGFVIAARALDVAALGIIVLIQSYVRVVDGLFNFQSVNVLTRYLAEADNNGDIERFRGLVKAGLLVDGLTAAVATAIAIIALPLLGPVFGIGVDWLPPAMLFCLVIITRIFGVAEAVLRCFDRFWSIGLRGVVHGALLVLASLWAWSSGADERTFLYIWLASEVFANLAFVVWALLVAQSHGVIGIRRSAARSAIAASPRFWPMLWQTNATYAIRMLSQDADVLVAGSVLGPGAAGLLRAVKSLAGVVSQLGRPLQQVASAPISRLTAAGEFDGMTRYAARIGLVAGAISLPLVLAAVLFGNIALTALYGNGFAEAKWSLVALLVTASLYMFGIALLPVTIALDRADVFLGSILAGTVAYFALMGVLIEPLGIFGVALAHVGFNLVWLIAGVGATASVVRAAKTGATRG